MEIIKEIKTEEKYLKDLNLKVISLKEENYEDNFYFLEEELKEILEEKLKEKGFIFENIKISYSLSYCQGDGFSFEGTLKSKDCEFKIKRINSIYSHYNTTEKFLIQNKIKGKWVFFEEQTQKEQEKSEEKLNNFLEEYKYICREMEKIGYSIIENQQTDNILKSGFYDFMRENNLNEKDLFDFDYKTTEEKGFIKICDSGNTRIKGLWIKNQKIKITYFIKASIEEYLEKTLI